MIRSAYLVASLFFAGLVLAKFSPQTGLTSLIRFGETWQDRRHSALRDLPLATVAGSSGYDGQFYAQIALDPLLRGQELEHVIDAPTYRTRRILTPGIAALLGFGNPWWTLQAYALVNVLCWFALGWVLRGAIGQTDWSSFARWAGCMFSMGILESVRQSLVDLPALLLLALAVHAWTKTRQTRSVVCLALGNLAKETNLLGMIALNAEALITKPRRGRALVMLLIATIPLGLWSFYVHLRFDPAAATEGLENFTWPLLGWYAEAQLCLTEVFHGQLDGRYTFGLLALVGLPIQAIVLWRNPRLNSPWWRIGAAYSLLLPFLGVWVWSGYWAACRAVLPLTIAFNLLLPSNRAFWPLWFVGNLTLAHAIWRFL